MNGREDSKLNDLFFVCSLIEYVGRQTKNERKIIVNALGSKGVEHYYELAEVYHCENIDKVDLNEFDWRRLAKEMYVDSCFEERVKCFVDDTVVYEDTDKEAEFPGGRDSLMKFLNRKIRSECDTYHENEVIRIKVIVEKDGSITHPCVVSDYNALGRQKKSRTLQ